MRLAGRLQRRPHHRADVGDLQARTTAHERRPRGEPVRTRGEGLRLLRPGAAFRIPRVYFAASDETGLSNLVLEDLSTSAVPGDQIAGCSIEEGAAVVRELAVLHRTYWRSSELDGLDWLSDPRAMAPVYARRCARAARMAGRPDLGRGLSDHRRLRPPRGAMARGAARASHARARRSARGQRALRALGRREAAGVPHRLAARDVGGSAVRRRVLPVGQPPARRTGAPASASSSPRTRARSPRSIPATPSTRRSRATASTSSRVSGSRASPRRSSREASTTRTSSLRSPSATPLRFATGTASRRSRRGPELNARRSYEARFTPPPRRPNTLSGVSAARSLGSDARERVRSRQIGIRVADAARLQLAGQDALDDHAHLVRGCRARVEPGALEREAHRAARLEPGQLGPALERLADVIERA